MPRKLINQSNYEEGRGQEVITEPSMTVPGEARTIKDIVNRYQQSGMIPGELEGDAKYLDIEDLKYMNQNFKWKPEDLTDLQELQEHNQRLKQTIDEAVKRKEEREAEEAKEAELAEQEAQIRADIEAEKKSISGES